jgi:hypothetical protein
LDPDAESPAASATLRPATLLSDDARFGTDTAPAGGPGGGVASAGSGSPIQTSPSQ